MTAKKRVKSPFSCGRQGSARWTASQTVQQLSSLSRYIVITVNTYLLVWCWRSYFPTIKYIDYSINQTSKKSLRLISPPFSSPGPGWHYFTACPTPFRLAPAQKVFLRTQPKAWTFEQIWNYGTWTSNHGLLFMYTPCSSSAFVSVD